MNNEGSRVLFNEGHTLYECAIVIEAGAPRCESHEVAPGAGFLGVNIVGASEDGNYIYFVSNNVVGDGVERGAVNGNCGRGEPFRRMENGNAPRPQVPATSTWSTTRAARGAGEQPALVGVLSGDDEPAWAKF